MTLHCCFAVLVHGSGEHCKTGSLGQELCQSVVGVGSTSASCLLPCSVHRMFRGWWLRESGGRDLQMQQRPKLSRAELPCHMHARGCWQGPSYAWEGTKQLKPEVQKQWAWCVAAWRGLGGFSEVSWARPTVPLSQVAGTGTGTGALGVQLVGLRSVAASCCDALCSSLQLLHAASGPSPQALLADQSSWCQCTTHVA